MGNAGSKDYRVIRNCILHKVAIAYLQWFLDMIQSSSRDWDRDLHTEFMDIYNSVYNTPPDKFSGLTPESYSIINSVYQYYTENAEQEYRKI